MTRAARRRNVALLVVAPAAVGLLTLTTAWASEHAPQPQAAHQVTQPSPAIANVRLRTQLRAAANDLQQSQVSALRLDASLRDRSDRLRLLAKVVRTDAGTDTSSPATSGSGAGGNVVASPPSTVAVPAAPRVSTTTGAS